MLTTPINPDCGAGFEFGPSSNRVCPILPSFLQYAMYRILRLGPKHGLHRLASPIFSLTIPTMSSSQVCFQFRDTGSCRYGASCKFMHTQINASPSPVTFTRVSPYLQQLYTTERPSRNQERSTSGRTHIQDFFEQYPGFDYDASSPVMREFYRMCDLFDWDRDDPRRLRAREKLKDAMTLQFNQMYGEDENDLGSWQNLCGVCEVESIPDDLEECRNVNLPSINGKHTPIHRRLVQSIHVNLVDLVDRHNPNSPVKLFESEAALSEYTKTTGNFFPKKNAYAGGLLKFLLRHIMNPSRPPPSSVSRKRHRR